jgi:hypothetical protein
MNIAELKYETLGKVYQINIGPRIQLGVIRERPEENIVARQELNNVLLQKQTVLGFDIFQYSQYDEEKQLLIPSLFELIYNDAWNLVIQNYSFVFQKYDHFKIANTIDYKKYFINTGDGGFQIIDSPIHAILFLVVFATILRFYNSGLYLPLVKEKIGNVDIRYAITYDNVYKYKDNYYGTGIITNSRMMSKDKLNRLLMDSNTNNWFLENITGIENLLSIGLHDISTLKEFEDYDEKRIEDGNNVLISSYTVINKTEGFKSIDVQKIGETTEKKTKMDVYNIHIQAIIDYRSFFGVQKIVTVSVGNLNTAGISNSV